MFVILLVLASGDQLKCMVRCVRSFTVILILEISAKSNMCIFQEENTDSAKSQWTTKKDQAKDDFKPEKDIYCIRTVR